MESVAELAVFLRDDGGAHVTAEGVCGDGARGDVHEAHGRVGGLGASAARENLDAGKKNAILYEEDEDASLPGDMSTGAVMEMGAACSFWGFAVTPMNLARRMKEPPWSPSNMPR